MLQARILDAKREETFQKVRWYLPIFLVLSTSWVFLTLSDSQIKPSDAYVDYWHSQNPSKTLLETIVDRFSLMKEFYYEKKQEK